jgi:O-antigen/teichoic acid export membrane protein
MRGARAGTIVFIGIAAGNVGNYVFHLVSARFLGPSPYGDVASLVALSGLVGLPLVGVQLAVARYVAGFAEAGRDSSVGSLFRKAFSSAVSLGILASAVLAALFIPLRHVLGIESLIAVVLTALAIAPAVISPVVWGVAQGLQRFGLFALSIGLGPMARAALAATLLLAGFGVGGAMGATLVAALAAALVPTLVLRDWLARGRGERSPVSRREAATYLVPVMVGVLSITSLTTIDVIVAKASFSDHDAGLYGSASLIGRIILYLPAAIVLVLLPKVSARAIAGRETRDLLAKSLFVTGLFCLIATAAYALAPKVVVFVAFGSNFEGSAGLLWMFAVAMSGYALLNVLLAYHLGRGRGRLSALLLVGALAQIAFFAVFHDSPEQLLAVDIAIAFTLLVAHEVFVERTVIVPIRLRAR